MSDHIPFEIQVEIIKRLPIKSLIQFRSVSKQWKSLIDSSKFIADYNSITHPHSQHHLLVRYNEVAQNFVSIADNDNTFPGHKLSLTVPVSVKLINKPKIIGISQGLFCFYGAKISDSGSKTAIIWNPIIRKSIDIVVPNVLDTRTHETVVGFAVCKDTLDPKLVKITQHLENDDGFHVPWQVEVFTLSSGTWRSLDSTNMPRNNSIDLMEDDHVGIDGVIYWHAYDTVNVDGELVCYDLIMSFDFKSEKFTEIRLPDSLALNENISLSLSNLKESLVFVEFNVMVEKRVYGVWMMKDGAQKSFTKIFTINSPGAWIQKVLAFRKSGEAIIDMMDGVDCNRHSLYVYEPELRHISYIGISGERFLFRASSYMETLLLLDH